MRLNLWKFILEWALPLGKEECPYAYRWRVDFWFFSFRLHKWLRSDDKRAYHSHPWAFITFILWGSYLDVSRYLKMKYWQNRQVMTMGSVAFRKRNHEHYVEILQSPTWSFVITFGAPQKYHFVNVTTGKRKTRDKYFIEEGHPPCDEH